MKAVQLHCSALCNIGSEISLRKGTKKKRADLYFPDQEEVEKRKQERTTDIPSLRRKWKTRS